MEPPPSAVTQPSIMTPAQSMLRRPAARAAVIACAAIAISDKTSSTVWVGSRPHMRNLSHLNQPEPESRVPSRMERKMTRNIPERQRLSHGLTEEPIHGKPTE